jgi:hypothetical protein
MLVFMIGARSPSGILSRGAMRWRCGLTLSSAPSLQIQMTPACHHLGGRVAAYPFFTVVSCSLFDHPSPPLLRQDSKGSNYRPPKCSR